MLLLRAGERIAAAVEDPVKRVVVVHRNRVEFVIVAAGAAQAEAKNGLAQRVDRVLDGQVMIILGIEAESPRNGEISGRGRTLRVLFARPLVRQDVAGDLFAQEHVVGLVGVERVDHVVSVTPRLRHGIVGCFAGRVGVANDVEPVPAPVLAVSGRRKQAIHDGLDRARGRILFERSDLVVRGRQTGQVESQSPQQRSPVRRAAPAFCPIASRRARIKRSMLVCTQCSFCTAGGATSRIGWNAQCDAALIRRRTCRPGGARADPGIQVRHLLSRERLVGGHRCHALDPADRTEQQALVEVVRIDRGPALTTLHHRVTRIEPQPAALLLRAVTAHANTGEHRPDAILEERFARGVPARPAATTEPIPNNHRIAMLRNMLSIIARSFEPGRVIARCVAHAAGRYRFGRHDSHALEIRNSARRSYYSSEHYFVDFREA